MTENPSKTGGFSVKFWRVFPFHMGFHVWHHEYAEGNVFHRRGREGYASESTTRLDQASERRAAESEETFSSGTNPLRFRRMFRREITGLINNPVDPVKGY